MNNTILWLLGLFIFFLLIFLLYLQPVFRERRMRKLALELGLTYRFSENNASLSLREYFKYGVHYFNILRGTINSFTVEIADRIVTDRAYGLESGPRYKATNIKINGFDYSYTNVWHVPVSTKRIKSELRRFTALHD